MGKLPRKVCCPRGHPGLDLLGALLHGLGPLLGPHSPGVGVFWPRVKDGNCSTRSHIFGISMTHVQI